jgi:uncharacterized protein (TIGR02246 family)
VPGVTAMSAHKPEDWPHLFVERLNAGDLESVVELYEPNACFVSPSGETIEGRDAIRHVLAGLIERRTRMQGRVVKSVIAGEVAVLYSDFEGTASDGSGKPAGIHSKAIEVLRRQPDGTWKLIVGDPNARGGEI